MGVRCSSAPGHVDGAPGEIDSKLAHVDGRLVGVRSDARRSSQPHAQAGEQLGVGEGLREVVVRPRVEHRDLVLLASSRGDDDDGSDHPVAQAPRHLESIRVRKPEVEQDEVGVVGCRALERLGARDRLQRAQSVGSQDDAKQLLHRRFVVHDEHQRTGRLWRGHRGISLRGHVSL